MFNIRLWFATASLGVIAALSLALGLVMSNFLTERLLEREAEVTQEFLQSILRAERTQDRIFGRQTPEAREALASFAEHIVNLPGQLRANIYSVDRTVLWSTDATLIGKQFGPNHELDDALKGERVTEFGVLDAKSEHVALAEIVGRRHFVETYIPLRGASGSVAGVAELYLAPDALQKTIDRGRLMIWTLALCGGAILYITLFWIVRRGALVIEQQQSKMMEMETLAAIGQMASAIAHSLRNPLAAIRSSAELLQSGKDGETREVAGEVVSDVDRMDRYVRELLHYTRSDVATPQLFDPVEVARGCAENTRGAASRQRVVIAIEDRRQGARRIESDPTLLGQALTSVITNAIEAMPEGGRLDIAAEDAPGGAMRLTMRDSGRGMEPETLAQIAQPFFTTKTRGLGLGLALAKRIAERFGGRLTIDSTPGRGTCVGFEFAARE